MIAHVCTKHPRRGKGLGTEMAMHHTTSKGHGLAVEWYHSHRKSIDLHQELQKHRLRLNLRGKRASPGKEQERGRFIGLGTASNIPGSFIALGARADDTHYGKKESRNIPGRVPVCVVIAATLQRCEHCSSIFLVQATSAPAPQNTLLE